MFPRIKNAWLIASVAVVGGAVYGIISYFVFRRFEELMTLSFLFLVPLVMGVIAALLSPAEKPAKGYQNAALAVLLVAVLTTVWQYESLLCWLVLAPVALAASTTGAFIVHRVRQRNSRQARVLFGLVVLPALAFQLEGFVPDTTVYQTTHNSIVIGASADTVWRTIRSVPTIGAGEYQTSWTHRLGLPRPLAATLSHEGVGALREASFTSGLTFLEEVTDWQPNKTLAFSITAQGTAEERTAFPLGPEIGGKFVDIESGRYTLEPIDEDKILLHLVSTQRLTGKMNTYAGFWVNAVMSDLQSAILDVVKRRCEKNTVVYGGFHKY